MTLADFNLSDDVREKNKAKLAEFGLGGKSQPASKYHNVRAEMKGLRFQSGHEAQKMGELMMIDEKHLIFGLRLQVKFPLPGGTSYIADATYSSLDEKTGQLVFHVVDAKGLKTPEFRIKQKLFFERYGQELELL